MKYVICILGAVVSFAHCICAEGLITDPVADFSRVKPADPGKLLKLNVDLNHTGRNIIFLSSTGSWVGKGGYAWTVYIPVGTKYQRVDTDDSGLPITFRPNDYFIGRLPNITGDVLLTYFPGGGGKGTFYGYEIVGRTVHDITVKQDFEPGGADKKTFDETLGSDYKRAVQELDFPKQ